MYGAHSTIGRQWYNQSAAVLGNIIGGAIFIGLMEHLLNHWRSPIFRSHHPHSGTLVGHDVESTRRARDFIVGLASHNHSKPTVHVNAQEAPDSRDISQEVSDAEGQPEAREERANAAQRDGAAAAKPKRGSPLWRIISRRAEDEKDAADNV